MELLTLPKLIDYFENIVIDFNKNVATPRIELGSRASETPILSIVLRGRRITFWCIKVRGINVGYFINLRSEINF